MRSSVLLLSFLCCIAGYGQQDKIGAVESLEKQVTDYFRRGQFETSLKFTDSILKIAPANFDYLRFGYETCLADLHDTARAVRYLEKIVAAYPYDAEYLDQYSWVLLKKRELKKARSFAERAYNLDRDNLSILVNYAHTLFASGEKDAAMRMYADALHLTYSRVKYERLQKLDYILLDSLYPGFASVGNAMEPLFEEELMKYSNANRLALLIDSLESQGVAESAMAGYYLEAIEAEKSIFPRRYKNISRYHGSLGFYYYHKGDIRKALDNYKEALENDLSTDNYPRMAARHENLGTIYKNTRLIDSAMHHYRLAGRFFTTTANKLGIAHTYQNMSRILVLNNQHAFAYQLVRDSVMPVLEKLNDHENLADAYEFISTDLAERGKPDSQRLMLDKAVEAIRLNSLPEKGLYNIYMSLASLAMKAGDLRLAEQYILKTISFFPATEKNTLLAFQHNTNLGEFYYYKGDLEKAKNFLEDAVTILFVMRRSLSEEAKLKIVSSNGSPFATLAVAYHKLNDHDGVLRTMELSRSLLLIDKLGGDPLAVRTVKQVQERMGANEALFLSGFSTQTITGRKLLMVITRENVQTHLLSDSVFIDRISKKSYGPYLDTIVARMNRRWKTGASNTLNNRELMIFTIYLQMELELAAGQARGTTSSSASRPPKENHAADLSGMLYDELIGPFEQILKSKKELVIVPDGHYSFLPFDALLDRNQKYLSENFLVTYLPSLKVGDILRIRKKDRQEDHIVLAGNPVFEDLSPEAASRGERRLYADNNIRWTALPATVVELESIRNIYKGNPRAFYGSECTETALKAFFQANASPFRVVHFATHGYVMDGGSSAVVLSQLESELTEDGYLTAPEIETLQIPADLVVLSACQTGKGMLVEGEGVQGLSASFIVAGANSLVVSLWSVSDQATQQFMTAMYTHIREGNLSPQVALRQVKLRFMAGEFGDEYKKPYYWAPFIYIGN